MTDNSLFTNEDIDLIKKTYANSSLDELLELFPGKTKKDLWNAAKRIGLKKNSNAKRRSLANSHIKYQLDENINFKILSPDTIALIGFIMADGYIDKGKNIVYISVKSSDIGYLEKIKSITGYEKPIQTYRNNNNNTGYEKSTHYSRLSFRSPKIVNFIGEKFPNLDMSDKSRTISYPEFIIGHEYELDFCRGFFDGNGGIKIRNTSNRKRYSVSFTSTESMCLGVMNCFDRVLNIKARNIYRDKRVKRFGIYNLEYSSVSDVHDILHGMYSSIFSGESSLYLERKMNRFSLFMQDYYE